MEIFQYLEQYYDEINEIYEFLIIDSFDTSSLLKSADEFVQEFLEEEQMRTYYIKNSNEGAPLPSGLSISHERLSKRHGGTLNMMRGISGPEPGVCLDGSRGIWREYTDKELQKISGNNFNDGIIAQLFKWNLLTWRVYDNYEGKDYYTSDADLALAFVEPDNGFKDKKYIIKSLDELLKSTRESRKLRVYTLQFPELWDDVYGAKKLAETILSLYTKE